ncbi:MAG TPA: NAD(P)/FAD-dependent oxidoreductase [bacterium]|jgi:protoporphyrinogen oxidase|nr:NAD(P)/FAD-dependent oxidoreductase [bacterium]
MKIGIVGGGIAGLTAGYRLAKQGHEVEIFEASNYVGGLAAGLKVAGTSLEKYYHHLFTSDTCIRGLVDELGIRPKLQWFPSQMGAAYHGKLYKFGTPAQILQFSPLPIWERVWFGLIGLYLGKKHNWEEFENITAVEWMKAHCGSKTWAIIWEPLLKGKFGRYYDKVAMAWLWARIHTRFSSRKGDGEKLGYFEGGFEVFHHALAEAVRKAGVQIHLNQPISRILTEKGQLKGLEVAGQTKSFDKAIFSAATPIFLKTCSELPADYVKRLTQLDFLGAQCLILVMKQKFSDMYWINISDGDIPILALIEHTNFVPKEWYQGKHLMYVANYLPQDHKYFKMNKDEIFAEILPYLKKVNPQFDPAVIEEIYLSQDLYAQPVVPLHYSAVKPTFETPIQNVILANMALTYPEDRGTNFAVDVGNKAALLVDPAVQIPVFKE